MGLPVPTELPCQDGPFDIRGIYSESTLVDRTVANESLTSVTLSYGVGVGIQLMIGGVKEGGVGVRRRLSVPYDATTPQEEVAAAAALPPDGRSKRDGAAEVAHSPPAGLVVAEQAELYGGFAAARTKQCGGPRTGAVAD